MKISYGITVCNEHEEIKNLLEFLIPNINENDEIVIVYDQNRITPQVKEVFEEFNQNISTYPFDFQQNFLENKNYLNSKCTGEYIFQIDADEVPNIDLLGNLHYILENNSNVDVFIVPRVNLVKGLTQEHINKWRWNVNEKGWVNWPDPQKRIYRNDPKIKWSGHQVHGMVQGYKTISKLPMDESFSIYHNKEITKQEQQNNRYAEIENSNL